MTDVLVRVDDRLVHGQVVVGWGQALGLRHIVLVDDAIQASPWEQDLYRMGVPSAMQIEFVSVADAATGFPRWSADAAHTILLLGSVDTLARLCAVAPVRRVNLGGIHQQPGRHEHLPYVFLTDEEADRLRALDRAGVEISAQDVPTRRAVPIEELLA